MANVDIEDGGRIRPRNKTQWWPCSTQENKTTVQILLDYKEQGKNLSSQDPPSIYIIPGSVRKQHLDFFKPQVVSIGPLHKEDETLKEFEERKTTYLHHLLDCLNVEPRQILDTCLQKVNSSIRKIRSCYAGMNPYTDDELAKMMVMDACFILDFIFLSEEHQHFTSRNALLTRSISRDLVLLENQIPFFVLQDIFDCTIHTIQIDNLTSGVLKHLENLNPFKETGTGVVDTNPHHILGLLQKSFHPTPTHHINIPSTCPLFEFHNHFAQDLDKAGVHSAQDLDKAGVKFEPCKDRNWTLAIGFASSRFEFLRWCWGNRTLRMPTLCIDDNTELFFRNLIAYEQCTPNVPDYVTSYVCAIDMLLDTKEDLSKLVESKVLSNKLGSNKEATKMLNLISKQFVFEEFYYNKEWEQLHKYYDSFVPKNIALLKRTYFNSPWNIIALLAGIVLFALTIVQTVLRIMQ